MGRGNARLDTGTPDSLLEAAGFVATLEKRQGFKIACLEEVAWRMGFVTYEALIDEGKRFTKSDYGRYILSAL